MKTENEGLQKFTESEIKINRLLGLEQITQKDIETLTKDERKQFGAILTERFNKLKGEERDQVVRQLELVATQSFKNQIWESNQAVITSAIANGMLDYGCMPSYNSIAEKTGLSRQTIHKHIKEYRTHPQYLVEMEQFRFMGSKVLAKVYKFAVNGDMRAAKLYFEMAGNMNSQPENNTLIQQQNNYIQINGTVLSQESIKQLTPKQLAQIEGILKLAFPDMALGDA